MNIRPSTADDIPALQRVVDATELFPSELLPDMIAGALADPPNGERWLTAEANGVAIGLCYAAPEMLTDGAWNMLAIAVAPPHQGQGVGGMLTTQLEEDLRAGNHRILIADTSGTDEFAATRAFYRNQGYAEEARIRDFWREGDDKVVFWKSLRSA